MEPTSLTQHARVTKTCKRLLIAALLLMGCCPLAHAQELAVKTNALQWIQTTPNAAVEYAFAPRWTAELAAGFNLWSFGQNRKFKHVLIRPEARFWLWEPFNGHFFNAAPEFAVYNIGGTKLHPFALMFPNSDKHRYEGVFYGISVGYGYNWMLSPRWSLEAEIGFGYRYARYRSYDCVTCGRPLYPGAPVQSKHWFGPTRLALSVVFMIR